MPARCGEGNSFVLRGSLLSCQPVLFVKFSRNVLLVSGNVKGEFTPVLFRTWCAAGYDVLKCKITVPTVTALHRKGVQKAGIWAQVVAND